MNDIIDNNEYRIWIQELKSKIKTCQIKAAIKVNSELINLYWEIGWKITEIQQRKKYGDGLIIQLSKDLKKEFPDLGGFSQSNLKYSRQFYQFWQPDEKSQQIVGESKEMMKSQQLVGEFNRTFNEGFTGSFFQEHQIQADQIPWGHNVLILQKIKNKTEALFYIRQTITNNWSRAVLQLQIETNLFAHQGKAVTNFTNTLPKPQSDLANQLLKDPYNFNFLTLEKDVHELELEHNLVKEITRFLLELGKGFAYMGRQFTLQVGAKEYRLDLLFYHVKLKCYIVIELKTKEFEPEFVGKLNFYLSAIDDLVKEENDAPTMGMLLCKNKDNILVEFALSDINKPIGVSTFTFNELPQKIQNAMPTLEELERELFKDDPVA